MTSEQQTQLFLDMLDSMRKTRAAKNKDYANEADSLANFRLIEATGLPAWIGILTRLGDKFARAMEQARKVIAGEELTFAVATEGFDDLCIDGANYFLLMNVAFQDWRQARATDPIPVAPSQETTSTITTTAARDDAAPADLGVANAICGYRFSSGELCVRPFGHIGNRNA